MGDLNYRIDMNTSRSGGPSASKQPLVIPQTEKATAQAKQFKKLVMVMKATGATQLSSEPQESSQAEPTKLEIDEESAVVKLQALTRGYAVRKHSRDHVEGQPVAAVPPESRESKAKRAQERWAHQQHFQTVMGRIEAADWATLLQHDQLRHAQSNGEAFYGFSEGERRGYGRRAWVALAQKLPSEAATR